MTARVRVLACGEPLRGDDGLAVLAVRGLDRRACAEAEVFEVGQLDPGDLAAEPGRPVLVVDAVAGGAPGELWDLSLDDLAELGRRAARVRSTHTLPPDQTVALAAALGGRPLTGRFLGLGVAGTSLGGGLSPTVTRALPQLVARIEAWIGRLA